MQCNTFDWPLRYRCPTTHNDGRTYARIYGICSNVSFSNILESGNLHNTRTKPSCGEMIVWLGRKSYLRYALLVKERELIRAVLGFCLLEARWEKIEVGLLIFCWGEVSHRFRCYSETGGSNGKMVCWKTRLCLWLCWFIFVVFVTLMS